jgi:hypothetical protein
MCNISGSGRPENGNAETASSRRGHDEVKTHPTQHLARSSSFHFTAREYFTVAFPFLLTSNMVAYQYPGGLIPFGPHANCTLELCPLEWSVLQYRPSLAANAGFIAIFSMLLLAHMFQGCYYRTIWHMLAMVTGCALQIVGYAGRVLLYGDPFYFPAFILQISELLLRA